jgi:hypothetical protein
MPKSVNIYVNQSKSKKRQEFKKLVIHVWLPLLRKPLRHISITPPRGKGNASSLDQEVIQRFAKETTQYIKAVCNHLNLDLYVLALMRQAPQKPLLSKDE